eukprot:1195357-Prorocentrum_minimum.AAC.2
MAREAGNAYSTDWLRRGYILSVQRSIGVFAEADGAVTFSLGLSQCPEGYMGPVRTPFSFFQPREASSHLILLEETRSWHYRHNAARFWRADSLWNSLAGAIQHARRKLDCDDV